MNDSFYYYSFKTGHSGHHGGGKGGKGKGKGKHSKIGHHEENLKHDKNFHEAQSLANQHNAKIKARESEAKRTRDKARGRHHPNPSVTIEKHRRNLATLKANVKNTLNYTQAGGGNMSVPTGSNVDADANNTGSNYTHAYNTNNQYNNNSMDSISDSIKQHSYIFTDVGIAGLALLIGQNVFKKKVIPDKFSTFAWMASIGSLAVGVLSGTHTSSAMAAGEHRRGGGNHNHNHPGHRGHIGHPGHIGHIGKRGHRGKFHPGHYLHGIWYPGYYDYLPLIEGVEPYPYPAGYPYPEPYPAYPYGVPEFEGVYPYYYGGIHYDSFGRRIHIPVGHHGGFEHGFHPGGFGGGGHDHDHDGGFHPGGSGGIPHPSGGDHGMHGPPPGGGFGGGGGGGFHPGGSGGAGAGADTAAGRLTHAGAHLAYSFNAGQDHDQPWDIKPLYGPLCKPGKPCVDLKSNYARSYHSAIFPERGYQEDFNIRRQEPYIRQTKGTSLINPPDVILPANIVTGTAIQGAANPIDDLNHVPAFVSDIY
jgi:hypothetical protein